MLVGTALTAAMVKYTFPYGWTWVESLLFGAMFSATDPVAVVAVLKEVRRCLALLLGVPLSHQVASCRRGAGEARDLVASLALSGCAASSLACNE